MVTVANILAYLESIAPQARKMEWDNVGLLCGRKEQHVKNILIALDPFENVADEAVRIGADLIVTHHPLIFRPIHTVTNESSVGRTLQTLIRNDISAISMHTNLDVAPEGVNQLLATRLQLESIRLLHVDAEEEAGRQWGLLRCGEVPKQPLAAFLQHVKTQLGTPVLRYSAGSPSVHKVAVGGGACAGELCDVIRAGCDTFVTADVKYNDFWDARDNGINLIDAGHFYTENPICEGLKDILCQAFPHTEIRISADHWDCMKFF